MNIDDLINGVINSFKVTPFEVWMKELEDEYMNVADGYWQELITAFKASGGEFEVCSVKEALGVYNPKSNRIGIKKTNSKGSMLCTVAHELTHYKQFKQDVRKGRDINSVFKTELEAFLSQADFYKSCVKGKHKSQFNEHLQKANVPALVAKMYSKQMFREAIWNQSQDF